MANNLIDRDAHAERIAFEIKIGRDASVRFRVFVHPIVDLGSCYARADAFSNIIEHADVHCRTLAHRFDILSVFQHGARRNLKPFVVEVLELVVDRKVAFLVFLAAATPAGIVAFRLGLTVVHESSIAFGYFVHPF